MDLRVSLVPGVLELKNPVLTESGTFGFGREYESYGDIASLGGMITNGVTLFPCKGAPMPRYAETASGLLHAVGCQNGGAQWFMDDVLPYLPWEKVPVIVNMNATNVDDIAALAEILSRERGVAALEVNLSCPNDHRGGQPFCRNPVTAARAVSAARRESRGKPVIAKLSLASSDIVEVARAVEAAGASVISCLGPIRGMSVDIRTRKSRLGSPEGRVSGPAIKPFALLCIKEITDVVKIPVIGIGGICTVRDVLEFILAGASAVGVGTAGFSDPGTVFAIVRSLPDTCAEYGIGSLDEFRHSLIL